MALGAAAAAGREASRGVLCSSLHFSMYTEYSVFLPCRGPQCVPSTETFLASPTVRSLPPHLAPTSGPQIAHHGPQRSPRSPALGAQDVDDELLLTHRLRHPL